MSEPAPLTDQDPSPVAQPRVRRSTWAVESLCLTYLLLLALAWIGADVVGERYIPTTVLAYAPPLLFMWPAPLLLIASLLFPWRRPRFSGVLLAVLTCGAALAYGGISLHLPSSEPGLRLLSYNVARGALGSPPRLAADILAANADVVALQEVNGLKDPVDDPTFKADLAPLLPGYTLVPAREVALFSRLSVVSSRVIRVPDNRAFVEARVRYRGKIVRVVAVHFATIKFSGIESGDVARTIAWRAAELGALQVVAEQRGGPLALVGDFNTPPRGLDYRALNSRYPDAFARAGLGFGWSFPASTPVWRIDHVFTRDLTVLRAETRPPGGSDHRGLLVVLK